MRRGVLAAIICAALMAAGTPVVEAQVKIQLQVQPSIIPKLQPKIQPKINKPPVIIVKPVIPPSVAVANIMRVMPTAKVLKVVNLPTGDIVATVRIKDQIRKIRVNGRNGAVQQ
jgi:hypothetical protein